MTCFHAMASHLGIYEAAALYDLAFSYRDFEAETRFILEAYRRRRGRAPTTLFELAAGPGRHALAAAAAGLSVAALDVSRQMAEYTRQKAELAGIHLDYRVADMSDFEPPGLFDLAICMLCSAGYLLSDTAVLSHLASVRAALEPDGMYLLELTHPTELSDARKSQSSWRMRDALGELHVDWSGDPSKAVNGIWESHAALVYQPFDGGPATRVEDRAQQRGFTLAELVSLAERSGFALEAALGGFDEGVALDDSSASRMMILLRTA